MENISRNKKLSFAGLARAMEQVDDNGKRGHAGNWEMLLGGYDTGYEIYYRGKPVARVNYELKEYELYYDGFITKQTLPMFLKAIDAVGFKNVHDHNEEDDLVGEEVDIGWDLEAMRDDARRRSRERDRQAERDQAKIIVNGREMRKKYAKHLTSNAQRDDVISFDKYKELLSAFDQAKPGDEFDIPEMEKYLKGWFVSAYAETSRTDWETGEDEYDAEQEFKADAQYFSDKDKSEQEMDGKEKNKSRNRAVGRKLMREGKYPMWWIRFNDSRNNLSKAASDMREAFYESNNGKIKSYADRMSDLWSELMDVKFNESTKIDEARKQIMWAINFRNMHTAVHGLFYGKDKKRVEDFANEIEYIENNADWDWDEKQYAWESLYEEYPDIATMDEFNYRDIVDLPGGYEGIEDGDTIYRFVNRGSLDIYNESTGKQKMKFRKIVKEAKEQRKLTGARSHITKDGMRGWTWDPKRDGYYITKNDFPEKFMDKFVPFLKGLRNEHCELDMWANSKNRLFIRWVGEKTKDKHWWHKLNINGSPANHEMASFARESLKEFVEEIEQFIGKSDLSDVIQVKPNWRFWEGDCKDKSCNIGGKVGSINFLSELEPKQVKNFYDNMDTYAMLESSKKLNESDEGKNYTDDTPKIYVGTYAKYNDGSIDGKWITISDYNTYEEFVDACRELHSDESDPEFMVQDYENFPEKWYHEGGLPTEEEFNKINDFYMMDDSKKEAYEVFVNYTGLDSIEDFEEAYEGQFDSPEDFGYYAVDTWGMPENAEYYIDYEAFGRSLTMDWHQGDPDEKDYEGEPEDPEYYYDSYGEKMMPYDSDKEVGEQYIDDIGIDSLGTDTLNNYFDYEEYGRTLLVNDFWEDSGYIFREI